MDSKIVPAIIAEDRDALRKKIFLVKKEVRRIHLDIMDGDFVPRKSNWFAFSLPSFKGEYEAHLMVQDVLGWLGRKEAKQFDAVVIHVEVASHDMLKEIIQKVKKMKKEIALAFNPETSWEGYGDLFDKVDGVQIMAVHPGEYGASFIPRSVEKVRLLRKHFPSLSIQVDGGENEKTIMLMKKAGANLFVVGGRIFKSPEPFKALWELEKVVRK